MLELAAQYASFRPVQIRQIAANQGVPEKFLVQILLQLKLAGLTLSTRGAAGGYRLAKPPEDICLSEIVFAIEGDSKPDIDEEESPAAAALRETWRKIDRARHEILKSTSLAEILESVNEQDEPMYHI